jgi:putative ABC transport system permease protein
MLLERLHHAIRVGLKSLAVHKLRSTLTVLGVVFGVGSVIVMLAVGEGAKAQAIAQIQELGATNIILRSVRPTGTLEESSGAVRYGLTLRDRDQIVSAIPTVVAATPMRERRKEVRYQDRKVECRVVGVTPNYQELNRLALRRGRFISDLDNDKIAPVAVLAAHTARTLFPLEDPIGRTVRVGTDQYFQVVGVTEPRAQSPGIGSALPAQDYNLDLYVPFRTERYRLGEVFTLVRSGKLTREIVELSQITVAVDEMGHVKKSAEVIENILKGSHPYPDTAMTVPLDLLEKAERTQRMFTLVLGAIASISLLVGGIGIMNIMLANVTERTREIGIRRALGAKRRDITWQFLLETVVLSSTGGVLGLVLGVALSFTVTHFFAMSTVLRAWSLLLAFTISVGVGLIFGTYPARRAAYMDPIEALRHE